MDITALPSLTDIYEGADQWAEVLALLPVLVIFELILSADNAVALAAIARASRNPEQERLALNIGIGLAMMLRVGLIALAQWVLQRAWVQLLAAAYLFWLFVNHLRQSSQDTADQTTDRLIRRHRDLCCRPSCCSVSPIWPSRSTVLRRQWR